MKLYQCSHCGLRVFFDNRFCEACGSRLGFVPQELNMVSFSVDDAGAWTRLGPQGPAQKPCGNYAVEGVCNWMLDASDPHLQCVSCRTTMVIPALGKPENRVYWGALEQSKRRVLYTLIGMKMPFPDRSLDPVSGLSFQFLEDVTAAQRVLTGHDQGVITLNIAEANDAAREEMRTSMHEPYRSLVGHFRHELGHYYWDRLINNTAWIDEYRRLFGDERADYAAALQAHYAAPVTDWHLSYISAYASSHPWEDWAECWAHYLHMVDGLETAAAWGLHLDHATPTGPSLQVMPVDPDAPGIEPSLIEQWLPVAQFSNAMNRSLGLHDSYPFVVPASVVAKLDFIHRVIGAAARGDAPMNYSTPASIAPIADESAVEAAPATLPVVDAGVAAAPPAPGGDLDAAPPAAAADVAAAPLAPAAGVAAAPLAPAAS